MKIGILGSAPASVALAPYVDVKAMGITNGSMIHPKPPFADQDWQLWGCSPALFGQQKRIDRWFELHRWEPGQPWFSPEYCQWLREFRGPVYVGGNIPEVQNAVMYPIDLVENEFSSYFLSSSISLMMALAILEIEDDRAERGAPAQPEDDTIGLWGVDMSATEEWNEQRPGCQFFVLEALRRGIEVFLPPESDLMRPLPVYGLSEWDSRYIKSAARMRELKAKLNGHREQLAAAQANVRYLEGAIDDHNWQIKTWCSRYGLPHGVYLRHQVGTGLGGGVDLDKVGEAPPEMPPLGEPTTSSTGLGVIPIGTAREYTGGVTQPSDAAD